MSRYKAVLDEGERSLRMLEGMLADLRVAMLRRQCHRAHLATADSSAAFAHHRAMARRLDGQVRRRLHDLSDAAGQTARMLIEEFDLDGGTGPG